ncbi:hypothetical protein LUZ60_015801 [Juncus effusus]|nr:hypothetical protein LUZ60_015801 [Juncus effusus]
MQPMAASMHSRIYEFAMMALINIFSFPYATVCELYCGGIDTNKWDDAQIGHYIGIDGPETGMKNADEIWENENKPYSAEFCEADPCTDDLEGYLQDKGIPADVVCCLHHLQLCSESEEKTRTLLHNVSSLLKPGGYFFGIVPDSSMIWTKYQKNVEASHNKSGGNKGNVTNNIRSENYVIAFEVEEEKFPSFGKRYQLKIGHEGAFESHCLVHFPSLIRLAREAGLEYIEIQNLTEFYDDNRAQFAGMLSNFCPNSVDPRGKLLPRSYDILGLYSIVVFQKPDADVAPPILTPPEVLDDDPSYDEHNEWNEDEYMQPAASMDEEKWPQVDANTTITNTVTNITEGAAEQDKGILGPGPAELRLSVPDII